LVHVCATMTAAKTPYGPNPRL